MKGGDARAGSKSREAQFFATPLSGIAAPNSWTTRLVACASAVFVATAASSKACNRRSASRDARAGGAFDARDARGRHCAVVGGGGARAGTSLARSRRSYLVGHYSGFVRRSRWFGICELGKEVSLHTAFPAVPPNSAAWASNLWDEWCRHLRRGIWQWRRSAGCCSSGASGDERCPSPSDVRSVGAFTPLPSRHHGLRHRRAAQGPGRLRPPAGATPAARSDLPPFLPAAAAAAAKAAGSLWIADHQPPLKYVRRRNARLVASLRPRQWRSASTRSAARVRRCRAGPSKAAAFLHGNRLVLRPSTAGALLAGAGTLIGVVAKPTTTTMPTTTQPS